jgi:hypoxanthine phosphoribosyltransferase
VVRILSDLNMNIQGRDVLIVEDIVDTGLTLAYIRENLETRQPASLRICALLDKKARRATTVRVEYVGFEIPDKFVVGYGLDFAERYRNLPHIVALNETASGQIER